jgi:hypothetical protein
MGPGSRERFVRRFGNGVTSLPLTFRLAFTAPFAYIGLSLVMSLISIVRTDDPRPAALVLVWLGILGYFAWAVLPAVWTSTSEWHSDQYVANGIQRRAQAALTTPETDGEWSAYRACPVCGQRGPAKVLRAEKRCPDCQRPLDIAA